MAAAPPPAAAFGLVALLLLTGCKGLEGGASTGGCIAGEAAASNTATGTLTAPKGMARFEFSAPVGTNFALCVW
jgi:hypothetical protein